MLRFLAKSPPVWRALLRINNIFGYLTLKIRQSSSRQLNFPACFHGIRKIVFSVFIHLRPGNLSLKVNFKNLFKLLVIINGSLSIKNGGDRNETE